MRNGLFLTLLIIVLATSCQFFEEKDPLDSFITLKPGYFCQLGAIAISGDTLFVAGSFIAEDNPNIKIQPIYSYLAAFSNSGKLIWEQIPEEPDYTQWNKIATDGKGNLYAAGNVRSPINNIVSAILHANSVDGVMEKSIYIEDNMPHQITDIKIISTHQLAFLRKKEIMGAAIPCINKQVDLFNGETTPHRDFCVNGSLSCTKFINDTLYFSAWGEPGITDYFYFINDKDSLKQLDNLAELHGMMVNEITTNRHCDYLLATTIKNGQGPCVYSLTEDDSIQQNICLDYWPMHGSVKMLPLGDCLLLAFNAADSTDENAAHIVILNNQYKLIKNEKIASSSPFIINDVAVSESYIYLAGTLETEGKGSEIAIKIISLPPNTLCNLKN